ncbi:MAG: ATP-binding cassette domain-containing protein, partial [Clostridia bacterium]|nr:ATP-binding cassette domain-containing protein [Clostridia bacterium]
MSKSPVVAPQIDEKVAIYANNLNFVYNPKSPFEKHALKDITLSINKGEFVAITGASGSGKSTLLNVISGMDTYEEGEMFVENEPTSHFMQPDWEEYRKKYISFIFQEYNIIESYTVLQNVELALMHIENK